jgi:diguanylate cyclase (GGDEF)-like protein
MCKKKILIIEYSELVSGMIADILKSENYDVVVANSGEEGLCMVSKENPALVLLDVVLPGMDGFEVCKNIRADEGNNLIPIIILSSQINEDDKLKALELGADDYIIKPFNPRELVSRVRNTLLRIDRNRYVNPLTGLPGNTEIQVEINHRIATGEIFSMIYADLNNFKAFNDAYGFACGDRAIKLTADIICNNVHIHGVPGDFTGHIGGDDFIIITVPACVDNICNGIINDFDTKIRELYNENDLKNGYIVATDRKGNINMYPIMTISLAVVSNEYRKFTSYAHVSEVAAEVKKFVKLIPRSAYFKDRRRN